MDRKNTSSNFRRAWGGRIIAFVVVSLWVLLAFWLFRTVSPILVVFYPEKARAAGMLGPLTETTGQPHEFEGYIFYAFERSEFLDCGEYNPDLPGGSTWAYDSLLVEDFIYKRAKAEGKDPMMDGYTIYIRFIGKLSWLTNAGIGEGYGNGGFYEKQIEIIDVLDMQPVRNQCQ